MEYKINQFNLCDINYLDLQSLINCFENCIPRQKISNIYLGPNLIHFSDINNKYKKTDEDKKLINTECQLIFSKFKNPDIEKKEEKIIFYSSSNKQSKIFLKRMLKNINNLTSHNTLNDSTELNELLNFYNFLSFFTCIKDNFNDEIPITDFLISISIDNGIKYNKIKLFQFNYEILLSHIRNLFPNNFLDRNNIHFFYMLLYNLPYVDLYKYLYCNQTKNFFQIYQSEISHQNEENMEEYVKRYVLINQFQLIKNDIQYSNFSKTNENLELIKQEYQFYKNYYEQYCKIKNYLMINSSQEQNLIGLFFAMILLCEIDFEEENIFKDISDNFKNNNYNNSIDLFSFIRNYILNDERFYYIQTKEQNEERIKSLNIFSKISLCLNISEEKIIYILLTDLMNKGQGKILQNENEIFKNSMQFITIIYLISIDKIKNLFIQYNKRKKIIPNSSNNIIHIYICRSNLSFENTFIINTLNDNPYFTISNNIIDSNSFLIKNNVKEHIFSNYIQEQKNFIYINNALSNLGDGRKWPKIKYNADYLNQIYLENFNFDEIMNLYENPNFGLLKYMNETSIKFINVQTFKSNFNKYIYKKGKIELVEVFDTSFQQYQSYIKVKHTFGTFLYDLNNILNYNKNSTIPNLQKEQIIYKFMEYKPIMYNNNFCKFNFDNSMKIINNLTSSNKPIFINLLIELNKYHILTIFDDFKINILYYYYSNYYNYILNVREIKDNIIKAKILNIPSNINTRDELNFFKFLAKRIRISNSDFYYENKFIFSKGKLSNVFDNDKNISMVLFKYNYESFLLYFCDKVAKSKFNYFTFAIKGIKAFVKLTKIFNEKRVLSNVRNMLTDIIVDNYDIISNKNSDDPNNPLKFNKLLLPKIDKLNELVFDFNKEALSKILPKLRSNLLQFTKIWKDYVNDLEYLEKNKKLFLNQENTQIIIEQRMINFQIILFLVSKNYKFINSESVKRYGVLVSEFTKTVSKNVLEMLKNLNLEFEIFLKSNEEFNKSSIEFRNNFEEINFEKLITKRLEIHEISRKTSLNNDNNIKLNNNKNNDNKKKQKGKEFNIPLKELNDGRLINHSNSSRRQTSNNNNNSINTITRNSNQNSLNSNKTFSNKTIRTNPSNDKNNNLLDMIFKNNNNENKIKKSLNINNNIQNNISEENEINDSSASRKKINHSKSECNLSSKENNIYDSSRKSNKNNNKNTIKKSNSNNIKINLNLLSHSNSKKLFRKNFSPSSSFENVNSYSNRYHKKLNKGNNNNYNNNKIPIPNKNINQNNNIQNKEQNNDKINNNNKNYANIKENKEIKKIKKPDDNNININLELNNNNNNNLNNKEINVPFKLTEFPQRKNSKKFDQFINSEQNSIQNEDENSSNQNNENKNIEQLNITPKLYTLSYQNSTSNLKNDNFKKNEQNTNEDNNNVINNLETFSNFNNNENNIFENEEEEKENINSSSKRFIKKESNDEKKVNGNKINNDNIHIEKKDNDSFSNYNEDNNNIQNGINNNIKDGNSLKNVKNLKNMIENLQNLIKKNDENVIQNEINSNGNKNDNYFSNDNLNQRNGNNKNEIRIPKLNINNINNENTFENNNNDNNNEIITKDDINDKKKIIEHKTQTEKKNNEIEISNNEIINNNIFENNNGENNNNNKFQNENNKENNNSEYNYNESEENVNEFEENESNENINESEENESEENINYFENNNNEFQNDYNKSDENNISQRNNQSELTDKNIENEIENELGDNIIDNNEENIFDGTFKENIRLLYENEIKIDNININDNKNTIQNNDNKNNTQNKNLNNEKKIIINKKDDNNKKQNDNKNEISNNLQNETIKKRILNNNIKNENQNKNVIKNKELNNKKIKNRERINNQYNQDNELKFSFSNINFNQKENINNSILDFEKLTEEEIEELIKTYSKKQTIDQKNNQFQNYFSFPLIEQNKKDMTSHLKNFEEEKMKKNDNSIEENSSDHNDKELNYSNKNKIDEKNQNNSSLLNSKYEINLNKENNKPKNKIKKIKKSKNVKKYSFEEEKNELNISALKELDEKISQLKKEINLLDNIENFSEQASLFFFKEKTEETDEEIYNKAQIINKDFYEEIESKLLMAEEALNLQIKK